jgi:thiamine biosynthesis lipoprotein
MTTPATLPRRAWVEQIMGLPVSVTLRGPHLHDDRVQNRVNHIFADLHHAEAVFSTYRDDSDLSRWQRAELTSDDADPTLREVLALCEEARERTDGWFDIRDLPDPHTGAPRVDPSGLVKGWAVQRAAKHLAGLSGHGWCINAGGDVTVASPAGHPPWRIGVEDPNDPGRMLQVLSVAGGAVATSGTAHRGAHIVDPHTGRPATAVRSATVVGRSLMWADVYATAAVARGPAALRWLGDLDGYEAMLVDRLGTVTTTQGWPPL